MKTITVYQWDSDDPSIEFVRHALNRLAAFASAEDDPAPNRVLKGNQFTDADIKALCLLLRTLATRARDKWGALLQVVSPTENDLLLAESVFQAAGYAEGAACELNVIFREARAWSVWPERDEKGHFKPKDTCKP